MNDLFSKIKLLALDFDGIMTDGYVYVDENGKETVKCSRKDGLGIAMLKKTGIKVITISKEKNLVVSARCNKLNIDCWQALDSSSDKLAILNDYLKKKKIDINNVAFMGDDLNDMSVLKNVGVPIAVADAHNKIKKLCKYITKAPGGLHAVREISELILESKKVKIESLYE